MYKTILAPIDGSATSARAFDTALQLARDNDAELRAVYVVDNPLVVYDSPGYDPSILRDAMCEEGKRVTDAAPGSSCGPFGSTCIMSRGGRRSG